MGGQPLANYIDWLSTEFANRKFINEKLHEFFIK